MPLYILSSGQTVVSADASAVGSMACTDVVLAGHVSNTGVLLIGHSANQHLFLPSGQTLRVQVSQLNMLYARTSGGSSIVTWLCVTGGPG